MAGMTARITAPVSRQLSVADAERAVAFYRDVLGFDTRPVERGDSIHAVAEADRGPARLQFTTEDGAWDSTGERRPRGAAIVFFETDDVEALRAEVASRGGRPSALEKANGIKMRVFQVQDPDGHTLWFAQSFQQPSAEKEGQLREALPIMPVADLPGGIAHYRDVLGFGIDYADDKVGVMYRDRITLLLVPRRARHRTGASEFYIRSADELHAELTARGARVQGAPVSHPWGLRDFTVLDTDDNELIFAETFE